MEVDCRFFFACFVRRIRVRTQAPSLQGGQAATTTSSPPSPPGRRRGRPRDEPGAAAMPNSSLDDSPRDSPREDGLGSPRKRRERERTFALVGAPGGAGGGGVQR